MNDRSMTEAQRLAGVKAQLAAIGSVGWQRAHDEHGGMVEARDEFGAPFVLLRFEGIASTDEMQFIADAPATVRFLVGLVDRAIEKLKPAPATAPDKGKDFAAEAAILCGKPAFAVFLEANHGLERPLTPERVAQRLRSVLGVTSRAELNQDAAAEQRWKALRAAYEAWKRLPA